MLHTPNPFHIIIRMKTSGRYLLLQADRYQKYYLIVNAPVGFEHWVGNRITDKSIIEYRTKSYHKACQWLQRKERECTGTK